MIVKSSSIDWQDRILEIVDAAGEKHTVKLDKRIHVNMIGYPEKVSRTMQANELGWYMTRGYIIEQIDIIEEKES